MLLCPSQFHYGSIKTGITNPDSNSGLEPSQFHYGSIKTPDVTINRDEIPRGLNSTMVRLKHESAMKNSKIEI